MADFSKTVLKKTLNIKYPDFFAVHFSECILVINGCTDHPVVRTSIFISIIYTLKHFLYEYRFLQP
jgi:hypothetical protein